MQFALTSLLLLVVTADSSMLGCSSLAQAQSAVQDAREAVTERVMAIWHAVAGDDQK